MPCNVLLRHSLTPTLQNLFDAKQQCAGVRELQPVPVALDDDAALPTIVGVDQGVHEGFPNRLVDDGFVVALVKIGGGVVAVVVVVEVVVRRPCEVNWNGIFKSTTRRG